MRYIILSILMAFSLTAHANNSTLALEDHSILGHQEIVTLFPGNITSTARIDTGAATNSMFAIDTEVTEENGEKLVHFTFIDDKKNEHRITRPLVDSVTVTQASGEQTRYVVEMGLCVGDYYEKTRFTLADRSRMTFPILVGRNFLENSLLVSSAEKMIASPVCEVRLSQKSVDTLPVITLQ